MAITQAPKIKKFNAKWLYKIISVITLVMPSSVYLLVSSLLTVEPNIIVDGVIPSEKLVIEKKLEGVFDKETYIMYVDDDIQPIYKTNQELTIKQINGRVGIVLEENDVVQFKNTDNVLYKGFHKFIVDKQTMAFELQQTSRTDINLQTGYKLPSSFIAIVLGVGIILLIVNRKMSLYKTYPRASTLIALAVGTLILVIINLFVGSLLGVFITATASWAVYCVEYGIYNNMSAEKKQENKRNDVIEALEEITRNLK